MKKIIIVVVITLILAFFWWLIAYGFRRDIQITPPSPAEVSETFPPISISPNEIRALYVTASVATVGSWVDEIIGIIKSSGRLNAVVIDAKDWNGEHLGPKMKATVAKFRRAGIYPIARIAAFQDNEFAEAHPDLAVRGKDGKPWLGGGKYLWVDPSSREAWDRIVSFSLEALGAGFFEANFDYIRFPSDGDMDNIVYPLYDEKTASKEAVITEFFRYLSENIRAEKPDAILSADLFAYSFLDDGGLGIGQRAGEAGKYFNVVAPMIYPSHYSAGNFGFQNPAEEPYQVVLKTLQAGRIILEKVSSTAIVRPWIQDFDLGAVYDARMVQEEMRAIKDAGYGETWMVWNPRNRYDSKKFLSAPPLEQAE